MPQRCLDEGQEGQLAPSRAAKPSLSLSRSERCGYVNLGDLGQLGGDVGTHAYALQ